MDVFEPGLSIGVICDLTDLDSPTRVAGKKLGIVVSQWVVVNGIRNFKDGASANYFRKNFTANLPGVESANFSTRARSTSHASRSSGKTSLGSHNHSIVISA